MTTCDQEILQPESGALNGIRVIDLTRVLAGPWASQLLGDLGADVIKIERPGQGDDTRSWGPPFIAGEGAELDAAYFLSTNRNKRSVTANLSHPEGADVVRRLISSADVVLENFRSGTMARFGLAYEELSEANPGLVMCSISAFGQDGSRHSEPGYDAMIQASGGIMSVTGEADRPPQKVGVAIADIMAGMYAGNSILAALIARQANGRGQYIDVPLYDSQVAWLANQGLNYLVGKEVPARMGSAHPNLVPYQVFATSDGHLMLAVGNDRQFRDCMHCMNLPELCDDVRFSSNAGRVVHREELLAMMQSEFDSRTTDEWLNSFAEQQIPAGPICSIAESLDSQYATERQLVRELPHAVAGAVPTISNPVRFSGTPVSYRFGPPVLGEHTREILRSDLGFSDQEIDDLFEVGAI